MAIEFQLRKSQNASQPYYWRVVDTGNNKVLCTSETYVNRQDAINAGSLVKDGAAAANFLDYTG